jgi:hypothetical protein
MAQKRNPIALPGGAAAAAPTDNGSTCTLVSTQDNSLSATGPRIHTRTTRFSLAELAPQVKPADLVPGRSMLEVRFAAHRFVMCAIRLNGKAIPLPEERFDGTLRQVGAVMLRDGFVAGEGINVLEFNVRDTEPGQVLPEVLSGEGPLVVTAEVFAPSTSPAAPANTPKPNDNPTGKKKAEQ